MVCGQVGEAIFTIPPSVKVDYIANADVDDSQKALVLLLELLLVKDLYRKDAVLSRSPNYCVIVCPHYKGLGATHMSNTSFQYGLRVFLMTDVVLVCSPPIVATAKGSGKP